MIGSDVTLDVHGSSMAAYLARPEEGSGPHPAVVVLQEVFGFTPEVRRVSDLLASIGYVALAIDYYHEVNPGMAEPYTEAGNRNAFAAAARVGKDQICADVGAAIDWLNAQPFVRKGRIAVWGMGYGAALALECIGNAPLDGAVLFYPTRTELENTPSIPVLLMYGEADYYVSRADMQELTMKLQAGNPHSRVQIYPDVGHSFFRHGRPEAIAEQQSYSDEAVAQAVADSWNLAQAFLRQIFSGSAMRPSETGDIHMPRTQRVQS